MAQAKKQIDVYLEIGKTKTFAAALAWPGWCRSGRDEDSALQALYDYGTRYARVLQGTQLGFHVPSDLSDLVVVERQTGNTTTDFGAPNLTLPGDTAPIETSELERWETVLKACWSACDKAVEAAAGQILSKGPRGGGRELTKIIEHIRDSDVAYLKSLGGNLKLNDGDDLGEALSQIRKATLTTLSAAVRGEIPERGPRGGLRWTPRYFVRRLAWHQLDHTWEIEDRSGG